MKNLDSVFSAERIPYQINTTQYLNISARQIIYWIENCNEPDVLRYIAEVAKKTADRYEGKYD